VFSGNAGFKYEAELPEKAYSPEGTAQQLGEFPEFPIAVP
jgi:hypothetical protein